MKTVAIIPARGGSKRIPKKNIKIFLGKPIIAYSIEAALKSGIFDEVMVSTDSEEIAEISRQFGASVPFMRSEWAAGDSATTQDVLFEVLDRYEEMGKAYDELACIYATAPFITAGKLKDAYKEFKDSDADDLVSVTRFSFPPQRGFVYSEGGRYIKFREPEYSQMRSQDIEPIFHDCGQFYFAKTQKLRENLDFAMGKSVPYILPNTEVQDIDDAEDWAMAQIKYRIMLEKSL